MYEKKADELLLATLAADSYSLGSHWVYDADALKNLTIDWETLNAPAVPWHEGKEKGDFTHYGDQIIILNNFLKGKNHFDIKAYMSHWHTQMQTFKGYVDGSSKETLINIDNNLPVPCGSKSGDMSVIGKIVPLLKVSRTEDEFLNNTQLLAKATHNNDDVLEAMHFFSTLLLQVLAGSTIKESIIHLKEQYSDTIQNFIELGINSKDEDTFSTISKFGSACATKYCFPSTIHLLFKYDDYKEALIQNAKAGGDSSARAMVVAYLLIAQNAIETVPKQWLAFNMH